MSEGISVFQFVRFLLAVPLICIAGLFLVFAVWIGGYHVAKYVIQAFKEGYK